MDSALELGLDLEGILYADRVAADRDHDLAILGVEAGFDSGFEVVDVVVEPERGSNKD